MAVPRIRAIISADTAQAETGFDRVERGLNDLGAAADRAGARTSAMGGTLDRTAARSGGFSRGIQNASFQIGDFATQVGAGTSASIALGQQLPQLLGGFGVLGAAMGAVVAIAVPLSRAFSGLSSGGGDLSAVLGVLAPVAERLGEAIGNLGRFFQQAAEEIINNLDRIIITAGAVAAFFAGRWVVSMVAAQISTLSFATALGVLRRALIGTGIGALVVAAGELAYQFVRLVRATGGFSEAMSLLGEVARDVFRYIGDLGLALKLRIEAAALFIQASFLDAFAAISDAWRSLVSSMASVWNNIAGSSFGESLGMGTIEAPSDAPISNRADELRSSARNRAGLAGELEEFYVPSLQKVRDILSGIKDDRISLPDLLGAPMGGTEGGGKDPIKEQIEKQIESLEALRQQGKDTWGALGTFVQQFAGKSKAAAVAALAINKGLAIAQVLISSRVAAFRALDQLGPIAGAPLAAKMITLGRVQAGLIAATGLAQAASTGGQGGFGGGGGGGSSGGGGGGGAAMQPQRVTYINLQGETFSRNSVRETITNLQDSFDSGSRIIVQ